MSVAFWRHMQQQPSIIVLYFFQQDLFNEIVWKYVLYCVFQEFKKKKLFDILCFFYCFDRLILKIIF